MNLADGLILEDGRENKKYIQSDVHRLDLMPVGYYHTLCKDG